MVALQLKPVNPGTRVAHYGNALETSGPSTWKMASRRIVARHLRATATLVDLVAAMREVETGSVSGFPTVAGSLPPGRQGSQARVTLLPARGVR